MIRDNPLCNRRDYVKYLESYTERGEGDPLSEDEFCRRQEELMDLLADLAAGGKQSPKQRKRLLNLRNLLLSDL